MRQRFRQRQLTRNLARFLIVMSLFPLTAQAQRDRGEIPEQPAAPIEQRFGEYTVYFTVFNSGFITPEIAQTYGIVRSKSRGLVNVSVVKDTDTNKPNQPAVGTRAVVKGQVSNLLSQTQVLKFDEIREQNATYYIADFHFGKEEILHFKLNVKPDPNKPPFPIKFSKKMYQDK